MRTIALFILCLVGFISCKNDDDDDDVVVVPEHDRKEQQATDNNLIIEYLKTHYYNANTFRANTNSLLSDLIIKKLPSDGILPDPANNALLIDAVEAKKTVYLNIDYEYYILTLNKGGGDNSPHFCDNIRLNYSGELLNETVFDDSVTPVNIDLAYSISGWGRVLPEFKGAKSFTLNADGTVSFSNFGLGVMFIPSGLGYFSQAQTKIPAYSPLIFKFELYQTKINDHDFDGVPSYTEDLNGDLNLSNDNTDQDELPNFNDPDDDGDLILTKNEDLEDIDLSIDSDGDGNPANDKNGDGDPRNDDTDGDNIPNYLDKDSTETNET